MLSRVAAAVLLLASACAPGASPAPGDPGAPLTFADHFALVYRCADGVAFVARARGDSVAVTYEVDSFVLAPVAAASGARYGDGTREFWSRGAEARLEGPGFAARGCVAAPASDPWEVSRLLGYQFRAVGQEPGWMVEVEPGRRMHVLADYGAIEFITGPPRVEAAAGGTTYRADSDGGEVVLRITRGECQDVMSGEEFPARATLELDDRVLDGCGRAVDG